MTLNKLLEWGLALYLYTIVGIMITTIFLMAPALLIWRVFGPGGWLVEFTPLVVVSLVMAGAWWLQRYVLAHGE